MLQSAKYFLNLVLIVVCTQFVFASAPDWEDCPGCFEFSATMTAVVHFDGVQLDAADDLLGAFDAG